jgi:hypothetical protein
MVEFVGNVINETGLMSDKRRVDENCKAIVENARGTRRETSVIDFGCFKYAGRILCGPLVVNLENEISGASRRRTPVFSIRMEHNIDVAIPA